MTFLLVGNRPALDLLNTRLQVAAEQQEMLPDTAALLRWLPVSGLVTTPEIETKLTAWADRPEAKTFLRQLRVFREELRGAVLRLEGGQKPAPGFLANLNRRLAAHPRRQSLVMKEGRLQSIQAAGPTVTGSLWAALLQETVSLLTATDGNRIRKCETCVVHFYDESKKNARRWCSMELCGNKVKVAAYQERQRKSRR